MFSVGYEVTFAPFPALQALRKNRRPCKAFFQENDSLRVDDLGCREDGQVEDKF